MINRRNSRQRASCPGANLPQAGAVYNASADLRSWQAMQTFFAEVL
jgi:dienelactone hydrolase